MTISLGLAARISILRRLVLDLTSEPRTCILCCQVALSLCHAHGSPDARLVQAEARVLGPAATAALLGGMPIKKVQALPDWHAVCVGRGGDHVVVTGDHWLLDPTLDQASRPEWGITLEPAVFETTGRNLQFLRAGCLVTYKLYPRRHEWTNSAYLKDPAKVRVIAALARATEALAVGVDEMAALLEQAPDADGGGLDHAGPGTQRPPLRWLRDAFLWAAEHAGIGGRAA